MAKTLLITVDTEGDNLWNWNEGEKISTENCLFIPRFQELCERYGFIPTYLTNYEMAMDSRWVKYGSQKQYERKCEIGLHIHAWNNPPYYSLENRYGGNSYITEYPDDIIEKKLETLSSLLSNVFEKKVTSARSGRWATNNTYFSSIKKEGILVDCSITPMIDYSSLPGRMVQHGQNYKNARLDPSEIYPGVIEVPMTTRLIKWSGEGSLKHQIRTRLFGEIMWLRPIKLSKPYLERITDTVCNEGSDFLEFMIHSSELMPGGSPYFKTDEDIETLFELMDWYFMRISQMGFHGEGLTDYANRIKGNVK